MRLQAPVDNRILYTTTPEYIAEYARRFIHAGTYLVGSFSGASPNHIRTIAAMVRALEPSKPKAVSAVEPHEKAKTVEPAGATANHQAHR